MYFYNARWYDPALGRFTQPDSFVQVGGKSPVPYLPLTVSYADFQVVSQWNQYRQAGSPSGNAAQGVFDPQFLNRYSYARNDPLAYVDDSGHIAWWVIGGVVGGIGGFVTYAVTHRDNFNWGEAAAWTAGGAVVGATFGAGAQWVAGVLGPQAAATTATAASPWALRPLERGQLLHHMFGANLPQNFPVIDRWLNGIATSIKSLDVTAATYQSLSALTSKVQGYINALANFQQARWGGIDIQASQITGRVLEMVIPPGATEAQLAALQQLQQYAASLGVTLNVTVVP